MLPLYSLYDDAARARKTVERMEKDNKLRFPQRREGSHQPELDAPASPPRVPYKSLPRPRSNFSSLIPDSHYCPPATYDIPVLSRRSLPQVPDGHAVSSWSARHPCERRKRRGHAFPYQGRDILPRGSKFRCGSSYYSYLSCTSAP